MTSGWTTSDWSAPAAEPTPLGEPAPLGDITNAELPPLNFDELGNNLSEIDWKAESLSAVKQAHVGTSSSVPSDFISSQSISVTGADLTPVLSFEEAGFPEEVLQEIQAHRFTKPTVIQSLAWPAICSGRDFVSVACTGSGKTLAYLVPALFHAKAQTDLSAISCLVLAPTRELSKQIFFEGKNFVKALGLTHVCLYGGNSRQFQMKDLESNPQIVIGTPGRILDFLENGAISLKSVSMVVLDEADKMLELGFDSQVRKIISQIRPDRQVVMSTATWVAACAELGNEYLKNPVAVNIGSKETPSNKNIKQVVKVMEPEDKLDALTEFIGTVPEQRVLVFVDTKQTCAELAETLTEKGITVGILHGGKSMKERMSALLEFRAGRNLVLIATDVASRGIDIKDLGHVVVYDFPKRIADYVYRIGRTGRAGTAGTALVFFTGENSKSAQPLIDFLRENEQNVPRELIKKVRKPRERSRSPRDN